MEEALTLAVESTLKDNLTKYLSVVENIAPATRLIPIKQWGLCDKFKIDAYPALFITYIGWNKVSGEMVFSEECNVEVVYNYELNIFLEGDNSRRLEFKGMRYRKAIRDCIKDHQSLGGLAYGCMTSSANLYNIQGGSGVNLEYGSKLMLDVYSTMFGDPVDYS